MHFMKFSIYFGQFKRHKHFKKYSRFVGIWDEKKPTDMAFKKHQRNHDDFKGLNEVNQDLSNGQRCEDQLL